MAYRTTRKAAVHHQQIRGEKEINIEGTAYTRNDVYERVALLDQSVKGLRDAQAQLFDAVQTISNRLQELRQTNWPLVIAGIMLAMTLIGSGSVIVRQQTDNTVMKALTDFESKRESVTTTIRADLDANTAQDQTSKEDRRQSNERLNKHDEMLQKLDTDNQVMFAKLSEVETQFRAEDQMRNVQHAEQARSNNILLQIAQGKGKDGHPPIEWPMSPYYEPQISQPQTVQ